MKNIFIIHSLNGDTLEFQGQDVKQKFEDKLNVFTPKFPIRAESDYSKYGIVPSKCIDGEIFEYLLTEKYKDLGIQVKRKLEIINDEEYNKSNVQYIVIQKWNELLKDTEFCPIDLHTLLWL